jgi:TonB family protein
MMEIFAGYLLKSAVWLTGFSLIYLLFLRNERFFRIKRIYLLTGILASFVFPLISFHYSLEMPPPQVAIADMNPSVLQNFQANEYVPLPKTPDYRYVLLFLYITGIFLLAFRTFRQLMALSGIIKKAGVSSRGPAKIVRAEGIPSSFSFFNYVFISPAVNEPEAEQILNHEEIHVSQKHWFDLLLAELLRIVQWANPFAWIYLGFIKQNHEYLADAAALERTSNPAGYRATLMNQIFNAPVISLSNSFTYSTSKKRFEMMKKIMISPYRKLKLLLVLPVIAILFYAFATPEYNYVSVSDNSLMIREASAIIIKDVKGVVLKEDGTPFTGVAVLVAGTKTRTTTDASGNFSLTGIPEDANIVFSYRGYLTQFLKAEFKSAMTVTLLKDPDYKESQIEYLYENKEPSGISLKITESKNSLPDAIIVIDGIISNRDALTKINPNSIQSMSVLKGVSATKVFGDKGQNGAIIVTLKKEVSLKQQDTEVTQTSRYIPPQAQQTQQQRPELLVVIDGVVTDKEYRDAQKELGYEYGITNRIMGKEATDKYGEKGANGVYEITTRKKALEMGLKPPYPRLAPEDYPTFQGGRQSTFRDWVLGQLKYLSEAQAKNLEGWVSVNFTVALDGTITNVKSIEPTIPLLGDMVMNVVKSSPKWDPPKNPNVDEPFNSGIMLRFKLPDQILTEAPFVVVEQMPMFPGGDAALLKFIGENTNYPDSAKEKNIQGRVIVRFIVNSEGKAEAATVLKGVDPLLDAEAVRIVNKLPPFQPGTQGGRPVNVYYMVPITFTLK